MDRPTPLSGFPELLPAQRQVEQQVIERLARTFELHGFASVETRAVEPLERLLHAGETSKEVYVVRRIHDEDGDAAGPPPWACTSTSPSPSPATCWRTPASWSSRSGATRSRRCWRGERPQEGRFREFTQADIDVIGRDTLAFHHDVEVARVMVDALRGARRSCPASPSRSTTASSSRASTPASAPRTSRR